MDSLENRQFKSFGDLEELEEKTLRYLALRDHKRKLVEQLKATNRRIKEMHRGNPQLMNVIGLIDRLQKKKDENPEAAVAEGDVEAEEPVPSDARVPKKRKVDQVSKGTKKSTKSPQPERAAEKSKASKNGSHERILRAIGRKETQKTDKELAKDEVQPGKN